MKMRKIINHIDTIKGGELEIEGKEELKKEAHYYKSWLIIDLVNPNYDDFKSPPKIF